MEIYIMNIINKIRDSLPISPDNDEFDLTIHIPHNNSYSSTKCSLQAPLLVEYFASGLRNRVKIYYELLKLIYLMLNITRVHGENMYLDRAYCFEHSITEISTRLNTFFWLGSVLGQEMLSGGAKQYLHTKDRLLQYVLFKQFNIADGFAFHHSRYFLSYLFQNKYDVYIYIYILYRR